MEEFRTRSRRAVEFEVLLAFLFDLRDSFPVDFLESHRVVEAEGPEVDLTGKDDAGGGIPVFRGHPADGLVN